MQPSETVQHLQIQGICRRHGVQEISGDLHKFLSRAVASHIGELLQNAVGMAQHRRDGHKRMPGMVVDPTANIMQQLAAIR